MILLGHNHVLRVENVGWWLTSEFTLLLSISEKNIGNTPWTTTLKLNCTFSYFRAWCWRSFLPYLQLCHAYLCNVLIYKECLSPSQHNSARSQDKDGKCLYYCIIMQFLKSYYVSTVCWKNSKIRKKCNFGDCLPCYKG